QRLNIHGAVDLETGKTAMIDVETVDAASTIRPRIAVRGHRGRVSAAGADPCVSRQCALSSCRSCAGVAGAARQEDQAAFHSRLLPESEPDRAFVGRDAQTSDPQQD